MERYTLDEARMVAQALALRGGETYYVVSLEGDYSVVSAASLGALSDKHHHVVASAGPAPAKG